MVTVELGKKKRKFKSIKQLADAAGVSYITMYMRLRMGTKPATAMKKPVRAYRKAA
jgi:hypothetical protein